VIDYKIILDCIKKVTMLFATDFEVRIVEDGTYLFYREADKEEYEEVPSDIDEMFRALERCQIEYYKKYIGMPKNEKR